MGGRDIDDLKEVGHKLKKVSCGVEKLMVLSHLIWGVSIMKNSRVF